MTEGTDSFWSHGATGELRFEAAVGAGTLLIDQTMQTCSGDQYWFQYQNYTYIDPAGTARVFPIYFETSNSCHTAATPTSSGYALDGSGYFMSALANGVNYVLAPDGTNVCTGESSNVECNMPEEDTNGNYFPYTTGVNILDTLNRSPMSWVSGGEGGCSVNVWECYNVLTTQGTTSQVQVTQTATNVYTAFGESGVTEYQGTVYQPGSIELPDGSAYQFGYDNGTSPGHYGELTSITLPTGGVINIGYTNFTDANGNVNRWVSSVTWGGGTWTYTPALNCGSGCQTVTVQKPSSDQSLYTFSVSNSAAWKSSVASYTGSITSGTLLESVVNTYHSFTASSDFGGSAYVHLASTTTTLPSPAGNLVSENTYTYDSNCSYTYRGTNYTCSLGKLLNKSDYQFGVSSPPSTAYRQTALTYLDDQNSNYRTANIVNRPADIKVESGGTTIADTTVSYDSTTLTSVTGTTNHDDTNYGTNNTVRGNPTVIGRLVSGSTYVDTTLYYDTTGQVTKVVDPNNNATNFAYSTTTLCPTSLDHAYLTEVTNALNQISYFCYDFNTGLSTASEDPNSLETSLTYDDTNRLYEQLASQGSTNYGWTENTYSTGGTEVDTYTGLLSGSSPTATCPAANQISTSAPCRHDQVTVDSWGRSSTSSLVSDPAGGHTTTTAYDSSGRLAEVAYPGGASDTYGGYDGLNRVGTITHADSDVIYTWYGANVSNHGGRSSQFCSTVGYPTLTEDEATHLRQTWTDGLGRLVEVDEPDPSSGSLTSGSPVGTCYTYDVLNDLTKVVQNYSSQTPQTRGYDYDGLGRLTLESGPEETGACTTTPVWANTCYTYDGNSNVVVARTREASPPHILTTR